MTNYLEDTLNINGDTYEEFKEHLYEIDGTTKYLKLDNPQKITFYSRCLIPKLVQDGCKCYYMLNSETIKRYNDTNFLSFGNKSIKSFNPELLKLQDINNEISMSVDHTYFYVSNLALLTLCERACLEGSSLMTVASNNRDRYLVECLNQKNQVVHIVYREQLLDGKLARKAFAFLGKAFTPCSQSILIDIIDGFEHEESIGKLETVRWSINQSISQIYMDCPEIAEQFSKMYNLPDSVVPGIQLQTSDVGMSSVTIRGVYRIKNNYVIADEVSRKHTSGLKTESIVDKVDEKIFAPIRKFPEVMLTLLYHFTYGNASTNLIKKETQIENIENTSNIIKKVSSIFGECLANATVECIRQTLISELSGDVHYTYYNIAMMFITLPERSIIAKSKEEAFRKVCFRVPFFLESLLSVRTELSEITIF